jgi:hypothetical protein
MKWIVFLFAIHLKKPVKVELVFISHVGVTNEQS